MEKIPYTIRVEKEKRTAFSQYCKNHGVGVSDAVEALIDACLNGLFDIKTETKAIINKEEEEFDGKT